jgi:competence protein ComEA
MPDTATPLPPPAARRSGLIARGEQLVLVLLALALVAGIAYRVADRYRLGDEPLEVVPPPDGPTYRVNVNTADWITLAMVPGLGEKLAKRIVETRDARPGKRFDKMEGLKEVRGIADKMLAKLRPYLVLDGAGADGEPVELTNGSSKVKVQSPKTAPGPAAPAAAAPRAGP